MISKHLIPKLHEQDKHLKAKDAEMKARDQKITTMEAKIAKLESILTNLALDTSHTKKEKVSFNLK